MSNLRVLTRRPKGLATSIFNTDSSCKDGILVIGIDFGTTYSGAAWATLEDFKNDQINLVTSWPGEGREEVKAPTELFYEYEEKNMMWGYSIPSDADPVRWFKLLLLKEEDLDKDLLASDFLLNGRKMLRESQKTAVNLIADYLRALWKHVLETIVKSRGKSVVDAFQFHCVITVPAIWKGYARQGMEDAARIAGILDHRLAGKTKLTFAPEPEAAALSTLCEPGRKIRPGDVYIICDAGGGTVDLISYAIDQVNPISMSEVVTGAGGLCGGIFIDEAFERACKTRLGRKWDRLSKAGIKELLRGGWEYAIKRQFKPGLGNEYTVPIPAEAFKGPADQNDTEREPIIKNGRIHFREHDIQKTFIAVFSDIEKLIDAQMKKAEEKGSPAAGIILVGGLGGSPYLYDHLKARYAKHNINVLQSSGTKPRAAICRGAIYKGFLEDARTTTNGHQSGNPLADLPIKVTSTMSRLGYGSLYYTPWNESIHVLEDKVWHGNEFIWTADNQMNWFIKKGDNVSVSKPVVHKYHTLLKTDCGTTFPVDLYECEDDFAPNRRTSSVRHFCTINCEIPVPLSTLEDFTNAIGQRFKKMYVELEMVPSGATLVFNVKVGGTKVADHNVQARFQ